MSYRVVYQKKKGQYPMRRSGWRKPLVIASAVVILLAALRISGIGAAIWRFLLPGDAAVTEAAISGIVDNIANGASVSEAISAFCEEIIHGA